MISVNKIKGRKLNEGQEHRLKISKTLITNNKEINKQWRGRKYIYKR